jgi:hypothetical protein
VSDNVCLHFSTFDCEIRCDRIGCDHTCSVHLPACAEPGCDCESVVVNDWPDPPQDHDTDLDFMIELRECTAERLYQIVINMRYGAPAWQKEAVMRALTKRGMT